MKHPALKAMRTMLLVPARQPRLITPFLTAIVMAAILTFAVAGAQAQTFTTIYNFSGGADGSSPWDGLALDQAGHLFGMTTYGGTGENGWGVVFEMQRTNGNWKESVIHNFDNSDGCCPFFNTPVFDGKGNLYGATSSNGPGYGAAFRLTPHSDGKWTEKILHIFGGGSDGISPSSGVVFDSQGNLYGVTSAGGGKGCAEFAGCGTVYELSPVADGSWKERVLHRFTGGNDGGGPNAVAIDKEGRVYGTGNTGGTGNGAGVAFQFVHSAQGWKFKVIHNFGSSGAYPLGPLALDALGNIYGTESVGGTFGAGEVFELIRPRTITGVWKEKTLYSFTGGSDGGNPTSGVSFDKSGNLYGTTSGGDVGGGGSVFKLKHSQGAWTFVLLHDFTGGNDGDSPYAGVVFDSTGTLYGTTTNVQSGAYWGTVYEITF